MLDLQIITTCIHLAVLYNRKEKGGGPKPALEMLTSNSLC